VDNVELSEDGGGVGCEDHLLEMVDNDLVAAIGAEGGLDGRGDGSAGIDVPQDGAIFSIVARERKRRSAEHRIGQERRPRSKKAGHGGGYG
jgi:hypothetical protein